MATIKKIFVIAGEASGDQHAAAFIEKIRANHPNIEVTAVGGEALEKVGAKIFLKYNVFAVMGFWEVLKNAKNFKVLINKIVAEILKFQPDVLLLVDSSGLNMRIAKKINAKTNIPIHYYIVPKIWAWGEWRIKNIKKYINYLYCILPFEEDYFRTRGFEKAFYVGNPTLQAIEKFKFESINELAAIQKPLLALLPGSRKQEISKMLPTMLAAGSQMKNTQMVLACSPGIEPQFYQEFIKNHDIKLVTGNTWNLLKMASMAWVTSGTATLETALIGCPQLVCYKTSGISYQMGKRLIKVKYISLVNLILDQLAVAELIQGDFNEQNLIAQTQGLDSSKAEDIQHNLKEKLNVAFNFPKVF